MSLLDKLKKLMPKKPEPPTDAVMTIDPEPIRRMAEYFVHAVDFELPADTPELIALLWTFGEVLQGEMERLYKIQSKQINDLVSRMIPVNTVPASFDVKDWQERDRQATDTLPKDSTPYVTFSVPEKWPWDEEKTERFHKRYLMDTPEIREAYRTRPIVNIDNNWPENFGESTAHFASPDPGPHLLRDRHGHTAWCRRDACKFCAAGVPPSADHHAEQVDFIDPREYTSAFSKQEMTIEEAKLRWPSADIPFTPKKKG